MKRRMKRKEKETKTKTETGIPQWLEVMQTITGLTETPGEADNPKILAMARIIGETYPEMKSYCDQYQHDSTAWCGLTAAYCTTMAGFRPPFGPTDTDKFLWAQSFASDPNFKEIGAPRPGAIVVMTREGGGHVTLYESGSGSITCRGGNQSDCVCVANYDEDTVIGYYWPKDADLPEVPVEDRPVLEQGDEGPDVVDLQMMIPNFTGEVDGDFGPTTKQNVTSYQSTRGLEVDGVVGQQTWQALYDEAPPLPPPPGALTVTQQQDIMEIANTSDIASYGWEGRGEAPKGWTQGMALAFAQSYKKLLANHPAVVEMAKARTNSDKDALNVYKNDFADLDMSNERAGADTLRHLYALMLGHGMRESSGEHCCGRDQSASNYDSNTCEAGAFQTSYNAAGASNPEFDDLMDEYLGGMSPGYLEAFAEGVSCSSSDWESYGSGRGREFQDLCKNKPAFSAESAALTLRNLCNHYGPIIRHETELKDDANTMFQDVQDYMDEEQPVPAPEVTVTLEVATGANYVLEMVEVNATQPDRVNIRVAADGPANVYVNGDKIDPEETGIG
jgi:uncharacterized protein (TIGR02594 family)